MFVCTFYLKVIIITNIWNKVYDLALKSLKTNDVPVGAIIVKEGRIIGKGYNTREKNQDVMGHAEINAIKKATKTINNWNLSGCDMYVTLRPCTMCESIIKQARIDNVYYLLEKEASKLEYSDIKFIQKTDLQLAKDYHKVLSEFFADLRTKKEKNML